MKDSHKNALYVFILGAIGLMAILRVSDENRAETASPTSAHSTTTQRPTLKAIEETPLKIAVETYIKFPQSGIACLNRDDLQSFVDHGARGEKTKMIALMAGPNSSGSCVALDPDKVFRTISVEYNDSKTGIGVLEIVGADSTSSDGAWTLSLGAESVGAPKK